MNRSPLKDSSAKGIQPIYKRATYIMRFCVIVLIFVIGTMILQFIMKVTYGGFLGRTWKWNSISAYHKAITRMSDSNFRGIEEAGWVSSALYDSISKTHGKTCSTALLKGNGDACPCMHESILHMSSSNKEQVPIFFLKLHKVGSTTVTSALLSQCVMNELGGDHRQLSSIWPNIYQQTKSFVHIQHYWNDKTIKFDASIESTMFDEMALLTPPEIEKCRNIPLRISHHTIGAYIRTGPCASATNIASCVLSGGYLGGPRGLSVVVLRKPVDRFVSSLYFWNCERDSFPKTKRLLMSVPPLNITMSHLAFILEEGRIDIDEPIHVLSRGSFVSDIDDIIKNNKNNPTVEASLLLQPTNSKAKEQFDGYMKAKKNLENDFDVVGIMEDMETLLTNVALKAGWDPISLAYKPARVRENSSKERRHHNETTSSAMTSTTAASTFIQNNNHGLWPSASKCSVRSKHLNDKTLHQISNIVSYEELLYQHTILLSDIQSKKHGDQFQKGLNRLKSANEQLSTCLQNQE